MRLLSLRHPDRLILSMSLLLCLSFSPFAVAAEEVEVVAEVAKLLPSGGPNSEFGYSVSLDGDRLAIGAPEDNDNGIGSGSAYIFEQDANGNWFQASKLLPFDGQLLDNFGYSVSLDGDRVAIGAPRDNDNGIESGSTYIFEQDADGNWIQVSKLLPLDGERRAIFGHSVSLDDDRLAIGSPYKDNDPSLGYGSTYIFEQDADQSWLEVSKLRANVGVGLQDRFGISVSLEGGRLAIGAPEDINDGASSGSAYIFERDAAGDWFELSQLLALDGQPGDQFGYSVSMNADRLAIGTRLDDDNGSESGSAYIFERDADGDWFGVRMLAPFDGQQDDEFGRSVSLDGDRVAIGSHQDDDNGSESGSVYVFERDADGSWLEISKSAPLDGKALALFGGSVSLHGDRVAIGAFDDDENGAFAGSAYIFETVLVSPQLTLTGTCPGDVELISTDTTPRSGIRLYSSSASGTWTFDSGPCEGTSLGLEMPTLFGQTNTDFDAENNRLRTVDASHCGTYLQVIDLKTCLTSEVVQVP